MHFPKTTMITDKNILITRQLKASSVLRKWAINHSMVLKEIPFIKIIPVEGLSIPVTDWIFFSSPMGAKLYLEKYPIRAKKIAALSSGTASVLIQEKYFCDFIGEAFVKTDEIGKKFFNIVAENESVFFPLSDISRRHISSQNKSNSIIEMVIYKTERKSVNLNKIPGTIIFTSPSNVDGYLILNMINSETKIIALGPTTAGHLKSLGYNNVEISVSTEEQSILELLE